MTENQGEAPEQNIENVEGDVVNEAPEATDTESTESDNNS